MIKGSSYVIVKDYTEKNGGSKNQNHCNLISQLIKQAYIKKNHTGSPAFICSNLTDDTLYKIIDILTEHMLKESFLINCIDKK